MLLGWVLLGEALRRVAVDAECFDVAKVLVTPARQLVSNERLPTDNQKFDVAELDDKLAALLPYQTLTNCEAAAGRLADALGAVEQPLPDPTGRPRPGRE